MQEKATVLESTQGVEGDKRYMRKVYNTLSKDNRKSWKYTLPRCEEPSSHMKGPIERHLLHWPFGAAKGPFIFQPVQIIQRLLHQGLSFAGRSYKEGRVQKPDDTLLPSFPLPLMS